MKLELKKTPLILALLALPAATSAQQLSAENMFGGSESSQSNTSSSFPNASSPSGFGSGFSNTRQITNQEALQREANQQGSANDTRLIRANKPMPPPLTPFQKLVYETTGRLLPMFGEQAVNVSMQQNELANTPVALDHPVGIGDEILVRAWGGLDINYLAKVDRDGQITIPTVGTFPVVGVKASQVEDIIRAQVGKYYKGFHLSASFGRLSGLNVLIAGQAATPGVQQVGSNVTLSSILFGAGRPGANGSYRDVQLQRGGKTIARFDLYRMLKSGDLTDDRKLQSGDVIVIGQAGTRIALNMDAPSAAIFELKEGETLDDVLSVAGVDRTLIRRDKVLVEGFDPSNAKAPRVVEQLNYTRALTGTKLRDGDIVTLFTVRSEFDNAITLKGNVADPARYPFSKGMRISDLIPSTDALITASYFKKKNNLVGFDQNKSEQALQDPRLFADLPLDERIERQRKMAALMSQSNALNGVNGQNSAINAQNGPLSQQGQNASLMANAQNKDANGRWVPVGGQEQEHEKEAKLGRVEQTLRSMMDQINWDYAVIERLDRQELKQVLLPFNLKKAMAKDPKEDLLLEPGDVVTVFGVHDTNIPKSRKTALVKVTGEVGAPGFYQVSSGETLRDVLVKAGGVTQNAYLFGTNLTRESIKEQQEKQLQKALDQAERLLFAANNSKLSSAITAADAQGAMVQQENQRQYLARLRTMKPDGRVVLDIGPKATSVAQVPPLELEDGDSITVPSMPGEVGVFGAVYSQGAYAYTQGRNVFDYLNMAGGAAKGSDKGSIFVLRANGKVDSAQQGWIPFVNGLSGVAALPGDAIYVPEDFERVSFVKTLVDISQVFYQIGLGAAAIKVLKD